MCARSEGPETRAHGDGVSEGGGGGISGGAVEGMQGTTQSTLPKIEAEENLNSYKPPGCLYNQFVLSRGDIPFQLVGFLGESDGCCGSGSSLGFACCVGLCLNQ